MQMLRIDKGPWHTTLFVFFVSCYLVFNVFSLPVSIAQLVSEFWNNRGKGGNSHIHFEAFFGRGANS
jgi:hypothetical protein